MECRCTTLTELYGTEAGNYVTGHLQPDADAYDGWALDDADPVQTRLAQV